MAALPAAIALVADRFKLEAKANWYWSKYYALDRIAGALKWEGLSEKDTSEQRGKINNEWEPKWPGFGAPPK